MIQFTEKRTDVNLAADLISDACQGRCKQAVLCSNDSDLVGALAAIRRDHPEIVVGLIAPVREQRQVVRDLSRLANWCRVLRSEHLAQCQLPDRIPGTQLTRPEEWDEQTMTGVAAQQATLSAPSVAESK